jgi:transposase
MGKVSRFEKKMDLLISRIDALEQENQYLKQRLSRYEVVKTSKNSSKPPSSDFPSPPKTSSLRKSGQRKPGGQPGHKGNALKMISNPSKTNIHTANYCRYCGMDLKDTEGHFVEKRQVIDIPVIKPTVTEHIVYAKKCNCGKINEGDFPHEAKSKVCYGANTNAMISYLSTRQYIPIKRTEEILRTIFGLDISTGGIDYILKKMSNKAIPFYTEIKERLLNALALGMDETGVKIDGDLFWAWVLQNNNSTYIGIHKNRGIKAIKELFPEGFSGKTLITDCWKPYFKTEAENHQICTAHLLRELKYFSQKYPDTDWSSDMTSLINDALNLKKQEYSEEQYNDILYRFKNLLAKDIPKSAKEVITFQKRMIRFQDFLFVFLVDSDIPPDNNASERAIRTFKVKQKVSGFFKSFQGATSFAIMRSIIDTAIKNSKNPFEALTLIAKYQPTE